MNAMVLTAGLGTRLGSLTRETPKPMLRIQSRPILDYIIGHLARQGFNRIVLNLHFMPGVLTDYFGNGARFGVELRYSFEEKLMGTAGGVKKAEDFLGLEGVFLVQYGDVLTDQDFQPMLRFHKERNALVTLLLHRRSRSNSIVQLDESGRIVQFIERPDPENVVALDSFWVNSGIYLCDPEILKIVPAGAVCDFPRDIFQSLVAGGRLFGFPLSGYRCAVDSPERLHEAESAMRAGRCRLALMEEHSEGGGEMPCSSQKARD